LADFLLDGEKIYGLLSLMTMSIIVCMVIVVRAIVIAIHWLELLSLLPLEALDECSAMVVQRYQLVL